MSNVTYPWRHHRCDQYIRKHDGNMAVIACFGYDNTYVDGYVYKNNPLLQRVINLSDDYLCPDQAYDTPVLIPIQFGGDTKQFIVLTRCRNVITYAFYNTLPECIDRISEESNDTAHIVINLAKMSGDVDDQQQCMECYARMDYIDDEWTIIHTE